MSIIYKGVKFKVVKWTEDGALAKSYNTSKVQFINFLNL